MIGVAQARAAILAAAPRLGETTVALAQADGRVLARPIIAPRAQPPFAASAMDGYALRAVETPGRLRIAGESAAGRAFEGAIPPGSCVRISTGGPVPADADAIVIQEDVRRDGDVIETPLAKAGRHIRPAGGDFQAGEQLLAAGAVLTPAALTLAAAAGAPTLSVFERPRVTLLSGGDEVVAPGMEALPHQIYDSARYGVAGLARATGADVRHAAPLPDDREAVRAALAAALEQADVVVMIGGASVGDHDHARPAARALGAEVLFDKVAVRPGKPTWFARLGDGLILGLPGNPASALVTARLFLAPLLAQIQGVDAAPLCATVAARLVRDLPENGPREHYLRARLSSAADGGAEIAPFEDQDSSLMTIAAAANALLVRASDDPAQRAGTLVRALRFDVTLAG
ncbi:MAG: molybdopterin molybdotransferase MoeA [Alphaproteobacteria bacterium]|nr:molybdopterin molybdotransferase MoeA [Alphaproteobacteria bacterium]